MSRISLLIGQITASFGQQPLILPSVIAKKEEGGIPMAGRKPKPTVVKKLEGNPGKRKLNSKEGMELQR